MASPVAAPVVFVMPVVAPSPPAAGVLVPAVVVPVKAVAVPVPVMADVVAIGVLAPAVVVPLKALVADVVAIGVLVPAALPVPSVGTAVAVPVKLPPVAGVTAGGVVVPIVGALVAVPVRPLPVVLVMAAPEEPRSISRLAMVPRSSPVTERTPVPVILVACITNPLTVVTAVPVMGTDVLIGWAVPIAVDVPTAPVVEVAVTVDVIPTPAAPAGAVVAPARLVGVAAVCAKPTCSAEAEELAGLDP